MSDRKNNIEIVVIWEEDYQDIGENISVDEFEDYSGRLSSLEKILHNMIEAGLKPAVGDKLCQEGMYNEFIPYKDGAFSIKSVRYILNDDQNLVVWVTV